MTERAGLGVKHIWWDVRCPAYRSLNPADCTCTTTTYDTQSSASRQHYIDTGEYLPANERDES